MADSTLGSWNDFVDALKASFAPSDKEGDVITKMQMQTISRKTADQFIKEFKNWQEQSRVIQDRLLIEWFMAAISQTLHDKILQLETPPITNDAWYKTISKLDNNWRKFKAITNHLCGDTDMKK